MSPTNLSIRASSTSEEVIARLEQYYCCACTEKEEGRRGTIGATGARSFVDEVNLVFIDLKRGKKNASPS